MFVSFFTFVCLVSCLIVVSFSLSLLILFFVNFVFWFACYDFAAHLSVVFIYLFDTFLFVCLFVWCIRGAFKFDFWPKLGIWTNRRTTPPPPHKLGHQIKKKNLMFILHFRQSLSIFFFFISYHFFGRDNEGGVQYPHELIRYCLLMYDNYFM